MSDERPTHLDLFSGIGGFSLAAEAAGFRTIGFSEVDSFASSILRQHWPHVRNYGDVRTVPNVRCDLITGGFPCQPFSQVRQSGEPKGTGDDRYLWPAMLDAIERCKPAWVLGENVNGIINLALDQVLFDLEAIGYTAQPIVVPACALDAAHIRERVWILANATGQRCAAHEKVHTGPTTKGRRTKQATGTHGGRLPELAASNRLAVQCLERPVDDDDAEHSEGFDGLPEELDAVKAYGNAIVPQIAEVFLRAIYQQLRP